MRVQNRSRNSDSATDDFCVAVARRSARDINRLTSTFSKTAVVSLLLSWLVTVSTGSINGDSIVTVPTTRQVIPSSEA